MAGDQERHQEGDDAALAQRLPQRATFCFTQCCRVAKRKGLCKRFAAAPLRELDGAKG